MMKPIRFCDSTLKLYKSSLTFRKKIDIAVLLDQMQMPLIEIGEINETTEDRLLMKSIADSIQYSVPAVSIGVNAALAAPCMESLKAAKHVRLQVSAALSTARMEYVFHKKANEMLDAVQKAVAACRAVCDDVEFIADDATRADFAFLKTVINAAIEAGATTVTVADTAGTALPEEFRTFLLQLQEEVPALANVALGADCRNSLGLANADGVAALQSGVQELKVTAGHPDAVSLSAILHILHAKVGTLPSLLSINT